MASLPPTDWERSLAKRLRAEAIKDEVARQLDERLGAGQAPISAKPEPKAEPLRRSEMTPAQIARWLAEHGDDFEGFSKLPL